MKSISAAFGQARLALSKIPSALTATVVAGLLSLGMSQPASATLIDSSVFGGVDSFTVNYTFDITQDNQNAGPNDTILGVGEVLTLSATVTYTATSFSSTSVTLEVTVENTASGSGFTSSVDAFGIPTGARVDITHMGFATEPDANTVTFNQIASTTALESDEFAGADTTNIPSLTLVEICAFVGNNCSGGGGAGVDPGFFDTFSLILAFDSTSGGVNVTDHGMKWQTEFGSFEFTSTNGDTFLVPEPSTLLLFGTGLLGLGVLARRRRRA